MELSRSPRGKSGRDRLACPQLIHSQCRGAHDDAEFPHVEVKRVPQAERSDRADVVDFDELFPPLPALPDELVRFLENGPPDFSGGQRQPSERNLPALASPKASRYLVSPSQQPSVSVSSPLSAKPRIDANGSSDALSPPQSAARATRGPASSPLLSLPIRSEQAAPVSLETKQSSVLEPVMPSFLNLSAGKKDALRSKFAQEQLARCKRCHWQCASRHCVVAGIGSPFIAVRQVVHIGIEIRARACISLLLLSARAPN